MTLLTPSKSPAKRRQVLMVFLLGPLLLVASCAHQATYRNVRVLRYTATTVPLSSEAGAEACMQRCEVERFRSDNGATATRTLYPSPRPTSDEDCRARFPHSRYDADERSCVDGLNTQAYADCLGACTTTHVEPGRCDRAADELVAECVENSIVVETANRQRGSCEQWHRFGSEEAPGEELSCTDYGVTDDEGPDGILIGIWFAAGLVLAALVVGAFVALSNSSNPLGIDIDFS